MYIVISLYKYYDDAIYILVSGEIYFLVLFTLLSGLTQTLIVYENVAVHMTNEVALARSKWLSTFVIDLNPYENFFCKLSDDLRKAGITAYTVDQLYESPSKQDFKSAIAGLEAEIIALQEDKVNLVGSYIDLHAIHSRVQRSLVSILGKGLNFILGPATATESDLKTIHNNVDRLVRNQDKIAHITDENISVINVTRVEMSENRQAINKIIGSLSLLDSKIGKGFSGKSIYSVILTIRFCYSGNKKNYLAGWSLYGTYTDTIKHVIFRSYFTSSYNPKRFEETTYWNRESLTRIP